MSNDLSAGGFTIMNMRDPIDLGDAVNLNYFNANIGATPSSIVNNLNLSSKLTAN